jgi:ribosomal protein L7Ae-like RNA K-turn-binding protein
LDKLAGLIHISRKAGKLLSGRSAVLDRIRSRKEVYVFIARDAGSDLSRKVERAAGATRMHISSNELGSILGRERLSLLGITDRGLADELSEIIRRERNDCVEPTSRI